MTSKFISITQIDIERCLIRLIPVEINATCKQRVSAPTPLSWQRAPYLQRTNYATLIAFHFFSAPREADATLSYNSVWQLFIDFEYIDRSQPFLKYVD